MEEKLSTETSFDVVVISESKGMKNLEDCKCKVSFHVGPEVNLEKVESVQNNISLYCCPCDKKVKSFVPTINPFELKIITVELLVIGYC